MVRVRGVTLLEMLVVIAVLGIFAALATPNLLPLVAHGRLRGATEEVAAFLDDARHRAATQGRCFRVRVVGGDTLVLERRNSVDCVNLNEDGWEAAERRRTLEGFTLSVQSAPNIPNSDERLVFRPNSRLRSFRGNLVSAEYGSRVVVAPTSGSAERGIVLATRVGRICTQMRASAPPALAVPVRCP